MVPPSSPLQQARPLLSTEIPSQTTRKKKRRTRRVMKITLTVPLPIKRVNEERPPLLLLSPRAKAKGGRTTTPATSLSSIPTKRRGGEIHWGCGKTAWRGDHQVITHPLRTPFFHTHSPLCIISSSVNHTFLLLIIPLSYSVSPSPCFLYIAL